jgi:hypothetical protein
MRKTRDNWRRLVRVGSLRPTPLAEKVMENEFQRCIDTWECIGTRWPAERMKELRDIRRQKDRLAAVNAK